MKGLVLQIEIDAMLGRKVPLQVLVCANTYPDQRPWRINTFNADGTDLAIPHLTVSDFPGTTAEVFWHLENQYALYPELKGNLRITQSQRTEKKPNPTR